MAGLALRRTTSWRSVYRAWFSWAVDLYLSPYPAVRAVATSHCAWPACARPGLLQIASVLLNLGPAHPAPFAAVKVPASTDELRAFGEKALRHALEGWFRERGLSYCTGHAGVRCTGNSDDGCVLNQWTLGVTMAGTQMTLRYQLPNPVQPLRPARFLDVHINGYLNRRDFLGMTDPRH